ncbi:MAG TPA: hypothetical protein VLF66_13685 [Thermoanaerobaculia bacterium]|nr:hypothetical protein [Thermoanaerobaculia bacterium]
MAKLAGYGVPTFKLTREELQ